jgi:hypothetical protein
MATLRRSILAAAIVVIVGAAAACGGDGAKPAGGSSNASQASVDDLSSRIQRNEMLFAAITIASLPLHDMDVSLTAGKAESNFVPAARETVRLFALTNWDASLKAEAAKLQQDAAGLLKALDDGNVDAAKDPAHQLHEGWHDFSDKLWGVLAKDLPADAGGVSGNSADDSTPGAVATAAH